MRARVCGTRQSRLGTALAFPLVWEEYLSDISSGYARADQGTERRENLVRGNPPTYPGMNLTKANS